MSGRDAILGKLRQNVKRDGAAPDERITTPARGIVPARSDLDRDGQVALFVDEAATPNCGATTAVTGSNTRTPTTATT